MNNEYRTRDFQFRSVVLRMFARVHSLVLPAMLCALVLLFGNCSVQDNSLEEALAHADSIVAAEVASGTVSGAVLMISVGGQIQQLSSHGHAHQFTFGGDVSNNPTMMAPDQVFDLASLTKVFATTMGIMMLVDEGLVALDEPVARYLPAFSGPRKDSVTVRHLLTHTGGLFPWKPLYYHAGNAKETRTYISELPLAYPVGFERHYSDLGFMLLGYIIEEVADKRLDAFLDERLYKQLGLSDTGFNLSHVAPNRFAATSHGNPFEKRMVADDNFGYLCDEDPDSFDDWRNHVLVGEVNDGNAFHAHHGIAGHAGLFSTASDLQVLLQLLLNQGSYQGKRLIHEEVVTEFLTADATGNGLGWATSPSVVMMDTLPAGAFGHTGFTGTYALAIPTYDVSIILLTNRQHAGVGSDGRYPSIDQLRREVAQTIINSLN